MSNPYQSPRQEDDKFAAFRETPGPPLQSPGLVGQVRVVAILMIVQGVLEVLAGLMYCGMPIFMHFMMASIEPPNGGDAPNSPEMIWMMTIIYAGVMGAPALIIGVLRIVAGIKNFMFRGRKLGMIAMIAGVVSVTTCYCAPTTIGLLVYGLIVFCNPQVKWAFQMGKEGRSADEILAAFWPYRPPVGPPPAGK